MMELHRGGQYRPLSEANVKSIHEASVRLMTDPGIRVTSEEALKIFSAKGASVDFQDQIVKIPRSMLEDAIRTAPSSILLCGRDERNDLALEESVVSFGTGGTVLNVLDLETGAKRPSQIRDIWDIARLIDALDHIHFLVIPTYPTEISAEEVDINRFYGSIANTSKHIMGGVYTKKGIQDVIKISEMIAGGPEKLRQRPFISFITCVMSPLLMEENYTNFLIDIARAGLPVACPAEPLAGGTGPCTIAGTITLLNTETLAMVVLAQLVNPGTPVMYATTSSVMDMKKGGYITGAIEMGLISAGAAQMAQFYNIPTYSTAGMSDSKVPDAQAGFESMATAMITGLAGANFIHDAAGLLEFCMTASYEQYVMDSEILGMCMRAIRGIEVDEETIAEDVIRAVGPGGNFLTTEHTLKYSRKEFFYPSLADRSKREDWEGAGRKDTATRARERARQILREHRPLPIEENVQAEILRKYPQIRRNP
jgi:trimethylamine--corrinoid protein Co-methyltransferase